MIWRTILTNNNPMKIDRFMKDSCSIDGTQEDNFTSKFQLDKNYENTDNTFGIPSNNIGVNDSLSHSGRSEIDEYASDIKDNNDHVNELSLKNSNNFVIHNHENIIEEVNRENIGIQLKQITLIKSFTSISGIETDKASNAPLISFDCILYRVKRYEGKLIQKGSSGFSLHVLYVGKKEDKKGRNITVF